ncbi:MAG: class I SAM-dependent DNA methyltransferase [Curvibacter sp.]
MTGEQPTSEVDAFVARWRAADGTELANAQSFVRELAELLGLEPPHPAREDTRDNAYVFERRVTLARGDGTSGEGRIDCYRRGCFVLEAKKIRAGAATRGFDDALLRARAQAETYARALPADEGRPPFLLVVDVGHVIEVYAEFSRSGATYTPFPDPRSHRIRLADLVKPEVQDTLRAIWTDPLSLDPTRRSARVTREIAGQLAQVAKALEATGHAPQRVAAFLSRCLFTMFAEDVGLLPKRSFADLLERYVTKPDVLARQLGILWQNMDRGEFSPLLETTLLHFNGKLFKQPEALPLERAQVELLLQAARADWKQVEPAIFGTLLERALDPDERHALGAHYTPRAYVERLVLPTIIEPLRADWQHTQAAALVLLNEHKADEARRVVREYLMRLCEVRVLDPACGSGNFLYVALEHMKRLEGEVLDFLDSLGDTQGRLDLAGVSVDPHQLIGIELNPRAAEVAEMVLWIGYLQWHFRTRGNVNPPLPVLKDFHNIECRDAVLAYDRVEYETDADGKPVTRWDGRAMKRHPVTGLDVPDDAVRVPVENYVNPRAAEWPAADFVIGNPPFIGNKRMRIALGDGYVEALRGAWPKVPETADLVMYWWEHAAELTRTGMLRRFGLITTNSLRQTFNRKVIERHLGEKPPLSLVFAVPDHPWVDSADGAAVRIAMTAGAATDELGTFTSVDRESPGAEGENTVVLASPRRGEIHADLTVGAKVGSAQRLIANAGLCFQGMNLVGKGFRLTPAEVQQLGYQLDALPEVIKPHRNARDMMQGGEDCIVIDLFVFSDEQARDQHPALDQWLHDRVKPERDHNNRAGYRDRWWMFGEARGRLRAAWSGLPRVILTPETSKHRLFEFQALPFCPDHSIYAICLGDTSILGVLSSRIHALWSLRAGSTLEDRPRWRNLMCFDPFAFPDGSAEQRARIATLAEQIDAHRKRQQAKHPDLTLTGVYNVLEKLRTGESLSAKEKAIHDHGLVSVLRELHDGLDRAVFGAYGWNDLAAELVGKPGATTPLPDKPAAQAAAEE